MARINIDGTNVIVLDVLLEANGKKRIIRMALDTGATYVMMPWEVAESLGLRPELSRERIETITASGVESVPLVSVGAIRVGGAEAKDVKVVVHDLPAKSYVDGLLGLSFLRNFNLSINFKEGYLEL